MSATKTKAKYLEFLQTPFWLDLRWKAICRDGRKCTKCGGCDLLQAHHVRYRQEWTDTRLEDLATLCRPCHEKQHGIVNGQVPTKNWKKKKRRNRANWRQRIKNIQKKARKAKEKQKVQASNWKDKCARLGWSF